MPTPPDLTAVNAARTALKAARVALAQAVSDAADADAALADASRTAAGSDRDPFIVAANNAHDAATAARAAERTARDNVTTAVASLFTSVSTLDADLGRLAATAPLVLYPVRVETRFGVDVHGAPVLRVRIYPDEIYANIHETALTKEENDAGTTYWTGVEITGDVSANDAWTTITGLMPAERASYVIRRTQPTGDSPDTEVFPDRRPFKSSSFTRPGEGILPDRWVVRVVPASGPPVDYVGKPIPEPLTLTADPQPKNDDDSELFTIPGSNPALRIDKELAWTVDYATAESVGMAVTIPLTAAQATPVTGGFDRLLVFGVKSSMAATDVPGLLSDLMDAHHFTRGLSLVPQGTPTNNTEDAPSPLPVDDPSGQTSFTLEVQQSAGGLLNPDGAKLAHLMGVSETSLGNAAGYPGQEQVHARNMAALLWPMTLGYVVEQLMAPLFIDGPPHDTLRSYFLDNVRARGPVPAFRIGEVPYGVLPALSIDNWQKKGTSASEGFEASALTTFKALRQTWKTAGETSVPVVSATSSDPLGDLLRAVALQPSSRELRVRPVQGQLTLFNLNNLLSQDFRAAAAEAQAIVSDLTNRVSQPTWTGTTLASLVPGNRPKLVSIPLVAKVLNETQPLPPDLFNAIFNTKVDQHGVKLQQGTPIAKLVNEAQLGLLPSVTDTAFYKLARQSVVAAILRRAIQYVRHNPNSLQVFLLEVEIYYLAVTDHRLSFTTLLNAQDLTPPTPLGDSDLVRLDPQVVDAFEGLAAFKTVPSAEVDRLFSETLDLTSHRLDAWLTAYATRRVNEMLPSSGCYFGGYAFVENVRPVARTTSTLAGYGTVETQPGNGGHVQTPSLTHATAAAILRNGYLSYKDEAANKYAFDLSSARARAAREVFEELRAGQQLGAILGYRFERGVQLDATIDQYRFALRSYYPLIPNKSGTDTVPAASVAAVAARSVVDGLALWRAYQAGTIPFATAPDLPRPNTTANTRLVAQILAMGDALDGVSDLNVGEAAYQLVRGDVTNAAGNLDALARGARPPDPRMAVSQRGGIPTNHRAAVVFTGPVAPGPAAGWGGATPRATVEPLLDGWAGRILGDPTKAVAHVVRDPVGTAQASSFDIALSDLGRRPLDLVAIARAPASPNAGSILDRRIAAEATRRLQAGNDMTHTVGAISYTPATGLGSIPQVMEVARTIGGLLGGARPLLSSDLVAGVDAADARAATDVDNVPLLDELGTRADFAMGVLGPLADDLVPGADFVERLTVAAQYVPDAFPAPGTSEPELELAGAAVAAELRRRLAAAQAAVSTLATTGTPLAMQRVAQLRAIFGDDFLALPRITVPNPTELELAMGSTTLFPQGSDPNAAQKALQQAAQVYDGLGRFRRLSLYTQVMAGAIAAQQPPPNPPPVPPPALRLDVAQVPFSSDETWVGLPFAVGNEPSPGRQSLLLLSTGTAPPDSHAAWQGIVLQDWVELIPNTTEETGLAFHYDNPGAEAAQTILVVPPSSKFDFWAAADVWATLSETLDLAKIRAVDLELVGGMGQFLPAIFAPQNLQNDTPSTSWFNQFFNAS